jgi:hypothetical protein
LNIILHILNKILNKTLFGKDGLVCEKYIK